MCPAAHLQQLDPAQLPVRGIHLQVHHCLVNQHLRPLPCKQKAATNDMMYLIQTERNNVRGIRQSVPVQYVDRAWWCL